jgi:hypothetical protein
LPAITFPGTTLVPSRTVPATATARATSIASHTLVPLPTNTPIPLPSQTPLPRPTATPLPPPTKTPIPPTATVAPNPQAQLQGIDQFDKCQWTVTIALTGFTPNSNIGIQYNFQETDCDGESESGGSRSLVYDNPTDSNGNLLVTLRFAKRYGDYEMTLRDQNQNAAMARFSTTP